MKQPKGFERFPLWIVLVSNLVSWSVYFSGFYLLYLITPALSLLLFVYVIYLELSVYREGCVNCYYYGKRCAFGRGKIAKIFFKKGEPKKFTEKEVSMKDFLPSSLPAIATLFAGIYLLYQSFNWLVLGLTVWPIIVMFLGNPIIYGKLACPNCKQSYIGCPVCEMFKKRAMKGKK